jgi:hypothetical protein
MATARLQRRRSAKAASGGNGSPRRGAGVDDRVGNNPAERHALASAESYSVGYRKPPRSTQFSKGVSGNRRGRPKGARNVANLLVEALNEDVIVIENGARQRMSKLEAAFRQLADRGAAGDLRALSMLLKRVDAAETSAEPETEGRLDAADEEVAQALIERIRKAPQE